MIPESVRTIDGYAFAGCAKLKAVHLSEGIETISQYAFSNTAIETISFPKSVQKVEAHAFNRCLELIQAYMATEEQRRAISLDAFSECNKFKQLLVMSETSEKSEGSVIDTVKSVV